MKVLVTGGSGFIGSAVVDAALAAGHDVRVLDVLLPAAHHEPPTYEDPAAEVVRADVRDGDAVARAVADVDAVSHQAAMVGLGADFADVGDYVAHNDVGTAVLLRALHDRGFDGRLVLASSMVVYGEGAYRCAEHGPVRPGPRTTDRLEAGDFEPPCPVCGADLAIDAVTESAPIDPRNVYAATKAHQEHLVAAYDREHGSASIALRYHNVYGPRMPRDTPYAGVASIFRSAAERGEAPRVLEDGGQTRDFVHVHDVAAANLAALTAPASVTGPCNVASGHPHTVLDMATALAAAVPGAPAPEVVGGYRLGDVRHVVASPARATEVLGFTASVGFAEGMTAFATDELRG